MKQYNTTMQPYFNIHFFLTWNWVRIWTDMFGTWPGLMSLLPDDEFKLCNLKQTNNNIKNIYMVEKSSWWKHLWFSILPDCLYVRNFVANAIHLYFWEGFPVIILESPYFKILSWCWGEKKRRVVNQSRWSEVDKQSKHDKYCVLWIGYVLYLLKLTISSLM